MTHSSFRRLFYPLALLIAALSAFAGPAAGGSSLSALARTAPATCSPPPRAVELLPLSGPLSKSNAEISGLAWHGDTLLLLPQRPFRMSGGADYGLLFALSRRQIEASLRASANGAPRKPLTPRPITLLSSHLEKHIPAYEGFEALAFQGHRAFATVEAIGDLETGAMRGFLFTGRFQADTLRLDARHPGRLSPQTTAGNMAYEALLTRPEQVIALYEANGRNVNPRPRAVVFNSHLQAHRPLAFPALEYRLTDATRLDADGRFWVMNYFFPGERDKLDPAPDPLAPPDRSGPPLTGASVERLVEFQLRDGRIQRTSAAPLPLSLLNGTPRNWEGLARFRSDACGAGFLLVTDQYPRTMLGFVAAGASGS